MIQLSQETDAGSMNFLPSECIGLRAKADGHPGFFCYFSMVSPNSPLQAKNIKPGLVRTAVRVCACVCMSACVCTCREHVERVDGVGRRWG